MDSFEKLHFGLGVSAGALFTGATYSTNTDSFKSIGSLGILQLGVTDAAEQYARDPTVLENLSNDPYFVLGYAGASAATLKALQHYSGEKDLDELYEELEMDDIRDELE